MRLRFTKTSVGMLILFVISYLFFMLQQLPATKAIQWLPKNTLQGGNIRLSGLSGTVWRGRAAQLHLNSLGLSNLSWRLHAWPLLWGNVSLGFKFRQADAFGRGDVKTGFNAQRLVMSAVRGSFPATRLMPLFYGYPIALAGQVTVDIQRATLRKGRQLSLKGELIWREAALTAPQAIQFGDLQVKMQPKAMGSVLRVQDQGGPLQLQGTITLQGNGAYDSNISISARSSASPALVQSINILGRRDAQGNVQISRRGKLANW